MRKKITALMAHLSLIMSLLVLWGCAEETETVKLIRPVKTMLVEDHHAAIVRVLPGKVRASEKVDMAFQVSGQLKMLNAFNGQRVAAGTVLAELDNRDFNSNLKAARAEYQRAQADYRRFKELVERQLISKTDFDRQTAARDIAEANVEKAQKALDDTRLVAPFSGVVTQRYVDNFEDITAKQAILSLQNMSDLEIVVQVPENYIPIDATIEEESKDVEAYARFQGVDDRVFDLGIKEFAPDADPKTQTFELVLQMRNPGDVNIYPGMSAAVEATMPMDDERHLLLPASAIFASPTDAEKQYVWIVDPVNLTVSQLEVKIGVLQGDKVEVTEGLQIGMRVVTAGVNYLAEGDQVRLLSSDGA
ncbi:efflux RND transporter periplasmic adaptor subunit [Candidatus Pelagadaptatus aseana]|uniref:efflux RND transporter periplasmic adaptor subunit n=1 Tax=Candidatus Pelagadaptatus aseana TaxID=3120508 RepID=UPI003C6F7A9C